MPTHDLVADHGGVADGQRLLVTAAISLNVLTLSGSTPFVPGDVGKAISIWAGSYFATTTIASRNSSSQVVLTSAPDLSFGSAVILWGTENAPAFSDYNAWAILQSGTCTLTIPAGQFCWTSTHNNYAFKGIAQSVVQGAGKALTFLSQLAQEQMYFGSKDPVAHAALTDPTGNSARVYTIARGATTIRLKDISFASKFAVNRYIKIAGYDMQGIWNSPFGYPVNPFYYEDAFITSISGDTLTLRDPVTKTYKDTWPNWNSGGGSSIFEADPGGPATIYMPDASYDTDITLNDFTIDNPFNQSVAHGRHVVCNRIANSGSGERVGLYPTQNGYFEANDSDFAGNGIALEVDKINGICVFNNCTFHNLLFQSASPDSWVMTGGSIAQLIGTPKRFEAIRTAIASVKLGPSTHGRTDEAIFTNCTGINEFTYASASHNGIHGGGVSATMPMTNGVIRMANTDNDGVLQENPTGFFVPDTWLLLDNKLFIQVIDVTQDATYTYIQTSLTGGWPFTVTTIAAHPAPRLTVRGCTGTAPELEELNQAPARAPLYSYSKRTYVGGPSSATPAATTPTLWGRLVTGKFNAVTPYTGALTFKDGWADNRPYEKLSDYSTATDYAVTVNMHTAGERVIRAATTASGGVSGDTLMDMTTIGQAWFYGQGNSPPTFSANIVNGETPIVTVEYTMDQGIPPAVPLAVMPLRYRLHA